MLGRHLDWVDQSQKWDLPSHRHAGLRVCTKHVRLINVCTRDTELSPAYAHSHLLAHPTGARPSETWPSISSTAALQTTRVRKSVAREFC